MRGWRLAKPQIRTDLDFYVFKLEIVECVRDYNSLLIEIDLQENTVLAEQIEFLNVVWLNALLQSFQRVS